MLVFLKGKRVYDVPTDVLFYSRGERFLLKARCGKLYVKKKKKKKNKKSSSLRVYTKTPSKLHYASITNNEITIELIRNGDKLISGQTLNQEIKTIKNWHEVSLANSRNSTIQKVRNLNLKIISFIFFEFLAKESRRIKIKILSKLLAPRFRSDRVPIEFSWPSFSAHIFAGLIGSHTFRNRGRKIDAIACEGCNGIRSGVGGAIDRTRR